MAVCFVLGYYYFVFARQIDDRLHGERVRVFPRVYARPLELHQGQGLTETQLVDRLNEIGYAQRAKAEQPGEFTVSRGRITIVPRAGDRKGQQVRAVIQRLGTARKASGRIARLEVGKAETADSVTLDAPLLTSIISERREKRRPVALSVIPPRMVQAVLAIEDRRFYEHPGVDPIRMVGALLTNIRGNRAYLVGASTITQQLVKNFFLTPDKSLERKLLEQFMALVLERRASKDEILELYLNEVPLGQRGSFGIRGVAEAARLFFGKDVANLTLAEAATIAGVIQSPPALSPFNNPQRSRERRNVVLRAMADSGYVSKEEAVRAALEPLTVVQRALEAEAPYFVDLVGQTLDEQYPGLTTTTTQAVEVFTTLDQHLQRAAQDSVRDGLMAVDRLLSRRRRRGQAQAALMAVDPRTGDILALVGGRSYNQSQYNRATVSRRQPGSVFKPFVYLTAFEEAAANGRTNVTPASIVLDEPMTWELDDRTWTPENYEQEYDGPVTLRHALAHSRNLATVRVAEGAGYDRVADLWKSLNVGNPPKAYPSIALGVFEASPYEIATAYTIFPNLGVIRSLRPILRITSAGNDVGVRREGGPRRVTRADTTFLVTNMLRSVLDEGTGAGARSAGFALDAAGKTGTTNDLRDAWFVGFTPELLAVVWVGFDDNQPLGLSGAQAALPIWTQFMMQALAGHPSLAFDVPTGVSFVDIDADTGLLAGPRCPRVLREGFLAGTEPVKACDVHRF